MDQDPSMQRTRYSQARLEAELTGSAKQAEEHIIGRTLRGNSGAPNEYTNLQTSQ